MWYNLTMEIKELLKKYENNNILRPLLQLIPYGVGSALDNYIITTLNKMRISRLEAFFDELDNGKIPETSLDSEDYVHKFLLTLKYVLNTNRKEKIRMFANIFKNSLFQNSALNDVDTFEDYAKILDELSYREIIALKTFDNFTLNLLVEGENELKKILLIWDDFEICLENELGIPKTHVQSFMLRIVRSGCYRTFQGLYHSDTGGKGKLTPLYYSLKEHIERIVDTA